MEPLFCVRQRVVEKYNLSVTGHPLEILITHPTEDFIKEERTRSFSSPSTTMVMNSLCLSRCPTGFIFITMFIAFLSSLTSLSAASFVLRFMQLVSSTSPSFQSTPVFLRVLNRSFQSTVSSAFSGSTNATNTLLLCSSFSIFRSHKVRESADISSEVLTLKTVEYP